jgi:hypothetical protein
MRRFATGFLVLGLGVSSLAGCGGSQPAPVNVSPAVPMPSVAELEAASAIDVEIEGTWQGEVIVATDQGDRQPSAEQLEALKSMKMTMVFHEDGSLKLSGVTFGKRYESQNSWDFVDLDGNKLTLKSVDSEGNEKNIEMFFHASDSFDMPLMTDEVAGAMRFRKLR